VRITAGPQGPQLVLDRKFGARPSPTTASPSQGDRARGSLREHGAQFVKEVASKTNTTPRRHHHRNRAAQRSCRGGSATSPTAPTAAAQGRHRGGGPPRLGQLKKNRKEVAGRPESRTSPPSPGGAADDGSQPIADVMEKVGKDGVITVKSKGLQFETEYVRACSSTEVIPRIW